MILERPCPLCPSSLIYFNFLNFQRISLLAHIEALGLANAIGAAGGFVDVAAEKIGWLGASHPFAQRRTPAMLAGREFVEPGIERGEMHDEMERFHSIKCREGLAYFFFGIFPGRIERCDVAVAKPGPLRDARCGFKRAHLAVKVQEAIMLAKRAILGLRFVIPRQHPDALAQRF